MSVFRNATTKCKITGKNNAPTAKEGIEDLADVTGGICSGMTVTWIVAVLHGDADAVSTASFQGFFTNVLRFQGGYLQAMHRPIQSQEHACDYKMRKLAEAGAHKCQRFDYKSCGVNAIAGALPDDTSKPTWAAYLQMFKHAIGIASVNQILLVMDPNEGLFSYGQTKSQVKNFCADLCQHVTKRVQYIQKHYPNDTKGVTAAAAFNMTFWEKKADG